MANTVNVEKLVKTYLEKNNLAGQRIEYQNLTLTLEETEWNQTNLDTGINMGKKEIRVTDHVTADGELRVASTLTMKANTESFLEINSGMMIGNFNGSQADIFYPKEISEHISASIDLRATSGDEREPLRQGIPSARMKLEEELTLKGSGTFIIQPEFTMYQGWFRTIARLSGNVIVGRNQLPIEGIAEDVGAPKPLILGEGCIYWYVYGTAEIILENITSLQGK